jgi:hypothetical protein
VSSSDEFNDPFSEDAGGGLLEMEGGRNIQGAKGGGGEELLVRAYWGGRIRTANECESTRI